MGIFERFRPQNEHADNKEEQQRIDEARARQDLERAERVRKETQEGIDELASLSPEDFEDHMRRLRADMEIADD